MTNRLPFILLASLPFLFIIFLVDSFYSTKALAVTSNCVVTKIGAPQGDPQLPAACTSGGGPVVQSVLALAKAHLTTGTYVWGAPPRNWPSEDPNGNAPTHFDCSGFAGWVWYWGSGGKINLPGQTNAVWNGSGPWTKSLAGPFKDMSTLQPGDLVYFGSEASVHHVGIYEGKGGCGTDHCFFEYYTDGLPGRENRLEKEPDWVGSVRINLN